MANRLDEFFICVCVLFIGVKLYCVYTMLKT